MLRLASSSRTNQTGLVGFAHGRFRGHKDPLGSIEAPLPRLEPSAFFILFWEQGEAIGDHVEAGEDAAALWCGFWVEVGCLGRTFQSPVDLGGVGHPLQKLLDGRTARK